MINVKIRPATDDDIGTVQKIAGRTVKASYSGFLGEEMAAGYVDGGMSDKEIAKHKDRLFVMIAGSRIVAFAIILDDLLHLLMVDSELHRQGFGSRMLAWAEDTIQENGHSLARLETFAGNSRANAFYLKHGWAEQSRDSEDAGVFQRLFLAKALR